MERLTSYINEYKREMICRYEDCDTCEEYCPHLNEDNCPCLQEVLEKLAEYENLEEQGKLLKLPCVVGDTVYVKMQFGGYAKAEVRDFTYFLSCGFCVVVTSDKFDKQNIPFHEFGKTIFLTEEEVQEALKRDGENSQSKIMAEDVSGLANVFGVNFTKEDTDKLKNWIDEEEQGERNEKLGNQ